MQGKETIRTVSKHIILYLVWTVFTISQVGLVFWIRNLIVAAALLLSKNAWVPRAVDMWSMFLLGIIVLAAIFVTEAYLSKGLQIKRFWHRVGMVALYEGILAAVLLVLDMFIL